MKRTLLILGLLLGLMVWLSPGQIIDGRVTVMWTYPTQDIAGVTFRIYQTTNLTQALPWNFLTSVQSTNKAHLTLIPGNNFAYVTASNFWGESAPSNIAGTPTVPLYIDTTTILRGHQ